MMHTVSFSGGGRVRALAHKLRLREQELVAEAV